MVVATSDDEGRTWSEPRTIYTGGDAPKPFGTLTRLPSGLLAAPMGIGDTVKMLRSDDDGGTWQWSDPLDCRPVVEATPYGRIVQTPQGLLMSVFGKLRIDGKDAPCSGVFHSTDKGSTWQDFTVIACDRSAGAIDYGPAAVVAAVDGKLLAFIVVGGQSLHRSLSTDNGKTWTEPEQRLLARNPALVSIGSTLACVSQDAPTGGMLRVQFSDNHFDSWRCDRMLDQDIKGEYFSLLALDSDRLLMVHDRGNFKPEGRGTPVTEGIEVAMMQRNPAVRPVEAKLIPPDKRDRWNLVKRIEVPMTEGLGEMTITPKGEFLVWSGPHIYRSRDQGRTFEVIADAPKADYNAGVFCELRSGRWLAAYTDWSSVSDDDWRGSRDTAIADDGYLYGKLRGVKGASRVWTHYSDDRGKTWHGGKQPMELQPFVWENPYGRFIEEKDGTIVMTTYGCLSHEDTDGRIDSCGLYRSKDGGKTWGDFSLVAHDHEGKEIAYNEMDVQPLPDGTWVAVIRTEWRTHHGGEASSASTAFSRDRGRTWTKPEFAFIGAVSDMAVLPDGALAWIGSTNRTPYHNNGFLLLLRYLEEAPLAEGFDMKVHQREWPNSHIVKKPIATYQCPSDNSAGRTLRVIPNNNAQHEVSRGNYVFCFGIHYFFPPFGNPSDLSATHEDLDTGGPFMYKFGRQIRDFLDGTSHTVLVSEIRSGRDDEQTNSEGGPGGGDHRGAWSWSWGAGMYLHRDTPNTTVADCMHGQQCGDPGLAPAPCQPWCTYQNSYVAARSYHPGGVNVVYGDGHVEFYSDTVELAVWQALATIRDGEVLAQ